MGLSKELVPVLAVALLTWGGVFVYLLRLDLLTREVEKRLAAAEETQDSGQQAVGGGQKRLMTND